MGVGKTPLNQLNALPLISETDVVAPSETVVAGSRVLKFWNETALGITNAQRTNDGAGRSYLVTPYIDLRGMEIVVVLMAAAYNGVGEAGPLGMQIFPSYSMGVPGAQPTTIDGVTFSRPVANFTFTSLLSVTKYLCFAWSNSSIVPQAAHSAAAMSQRCRLFFSWGVGTSVNVNYTVQIHASS